MGQTTTKPGLKPPPFGCPRFWADSLVWIQVGIFTAPGGIGQAHSCTCSHSECVEGWLVPLGGSGTFFLCLEWLGLLDLSPKRPFSPLGVSSSLTLAFTCSQSERQHSKRVGRWDQHTKVTQHHFCHILFVKAGHRVSPHTRERDRPHFLTEGGGKNLSFLIHHEYRNLECSYHHEDFNLKQLQRINISSVWNKNESCIFPFQIQYVHLY